MPGSTVEDELPEAGTSPKLNMLSIPTTIVSSRRPGTAVHRPFHAVPAHSLALVSIVRRAITNQPMSRQGLTSDFAVVHCGRKRTRTRQPRTGRLSKLRDA